MVRREKRIQKISKKLVDTRLCDGEKKMPDEVAKRD